MDIQNISKEFYRINKLNKSLCFQYFNNYLFNQNFYFAEKRCKKEIFILIILKKFDYLHLIDIFNNNRKTTQI
jgi:hypothetical protein